MARPEPFQAWLLLQPLHEKGVCEDPTAEAGTVPTEGASRTFSF